jgi:hypothetical protein
MCRECIFFILQLLFDYIFHAAVPTEVLLVQISNYTLAHVVLYYSISLFPLASPQNQARKS